MSPADLRQVLADLAAAKFPLDGTQAPASRILAYSHALGETPFGRRVKNEWNKLGGSQIFLRQLQADLHRDSARRLAEYQKRVRSHKRDRDWSELTPSKAAKLRAEIAADEAEAQKAVLAELGAELNPHVPDFITPLADTYGKSAARPRKPKPQTSEERKRQAKRRQRLQDEKPCKPTIRSWSAPMSLTDYRDATGMQRGAVEDFVRDKLKARPMPRRGRPVTEPRRYGESVNLKVLAHWIEHWERKPERARDWALETLAFAERYDSAFLPRLIRTIAPVLARRRLASSDLLTELRGSRDHYAPKPDPFAALLNLPPTP